MYLGSWKVDDLLTFSVSTHDAATGAATDADAVPSYRIYEDETGTAILTGNMAKLDDANTTGFYSEQITLSAANGFEKGKSYNILISATVDSVTGTTVRTFQMEAEVDANVVSGGVNVTQFGGSNGTFASGRPEVNASHWGGTAVASANVLIDGAITAAKIATDAIDADALAADAIAEINATVDTALADYDGPTNAEMVARTLASASYATSTALQTVDDEIATIDSNVDTLLARITSTLFAGITSLAEWLGLIAGKQTGNTTARTELRATGAGSGTFDETTDSQEALRDRGDTAWTTATGFSTHSAADVWAVGTRTLTSFGSLVSDVATAVWGAVTRTLTAATNISGPIADQVWEEALADHSGTAGSTAEALGAAGSAGDPWATALPGSYTSGQAGKIIGDNLNATVSSRATPAQVATELATYDGPTKAELDVAVAPLALEATAQSILTDTAEIGAAGAGLTEAGGTGDHLTALATASALAIVAGYLDTEIAAIKAKTDNLPSDPADESSLQAAIAGLSIPTVVQIAEGLLNTSLGAGTDDQTRSVRNALRFLRNKWSIAGGTLTVTKEDDTTSAWTASVTQTAGDPVSAVDPA